MASRPKPEKKEITFPRRGEIYLVGFDPTLGSFLLGLNGLYAGALH